jgi:outer membrane immunogenic protein
MLANWTVRAEYLYVDLGSELLTVTSSNATITFIASSRFNEHIVRAGVNYRF